jgi:hypothetical protein
MENPMGCSCGMGDLASNRATKARNKATKGRIYELDVNDYTRYKDLAARKRELAAEMNLIAKVNPRVKPGKKASKVKSETRPIACRSDKFTGGCTATVYRYPDGSERTVIVSKVAKKKKSAGGHTSVAGYKKAKATAERKAQAALAKLERAKIKAANAETKTQQKAANEAAKRAKSELKTAIKQIPDDQRYILALEKMSKKTYHKPMSSLNLQKYNYVAD